MCNVFEFFFYARKERCIFILSFIFQSPAKATYNARSWCSDQENDGEKMVSALTPGLPNLDFVVNVSIRFFRNSGFFKALSTTCGI